MAGRPPMEKMSPEDSNELVPPTPNRSPGRPKGAKGMRRSQGRFNIENKKKFLKVLETTAGNQSAAAEAVGITTTTLTYHKRKDEEFARRVNEVISKCKEDVEQAITKRGIEGWDESVYYKGEEVGTIRKYSDTLLLARAKALMPERYSSNANININHEITVENKAKEKLSALLGIKNEDGSYHVDVQDGDIVED